MNRKLLTAGGLAFLLVFAGCAGLTGSPKLNYEGQAFQNTGLSSAEIGYKGSIANTGDAPAKNVSVKLTVTLQNGDTYTDVMYLGTIDEGESKNWKVALQLQEEDAKKNWDGAQWTLVIRGDNIETVEKNLGTTQTSSQ